MKWMFALCLVLLGCSPNSSYEFQREGKALCRTLANDLKKIESRQQLLQEESKLKKHFESLVSLMIEAKEFQQGTDSDLVMDSFLEGEEDRELEAELRRIYAIEGGREVIERAEQEALVRLDAYERALAKKQQCLYPK